MCSALPRTIFAASVQQLKSLMVVCMSQYKAARSTVFWAGIGLMHVANAALYDLSSRNWRYYFLFYIRSFQQLHPAFAVGKGIVQGLLAMAMQSAAITSPEAQLIMNEFLQGGGFIPASPTRKGVSWWIIT
ncbi:hypothetical protein DM02DRAFT_540911 [Periconia macrospinosa]|uniref:Uncharacterized protein n=1 Tax=Periconia macrospinosa TaxID=97972 RepID=A0A2V1D6R3_9PLEO|nr:hypothetical protein DM02DRAFT_540911 [Periconia macrospinosa]